MRLFSRETVKRASKFFGDILEPNESKRDLAIEMINEKHYKQMIDEVLALEEQMPEEKYLLIEEEMEISL